MMAMIAIVRILFLFFILPPHTNYSTFISILQLANDIFKNEFLILPFFRFIMYNKNTRRVGRMEARELMMLYKDLEKKLNDIRRSL